jgi:hypothetical protein
MASNNKNYIHRAYIYPIYEEFYITRYYFALEKKKVNLYYLYAYMNYNTINIQ